MAEKEKLYGWLFVTQVPLLCEEKKLERQQKIETWLNLYQITRELGIENTEKESSPAPPINYVA